MGSGKFGGGPLLGCAAFVVIVAGMKSASVLVVPFLLAGFLAIICAPPLYWMKQKGVPSLVGILLLMTAVVAVQVVLVSLISSSIADFSQNLPQYQERLAGLISSGLALLSDYGIQVENPQLAELLNPSRILGLAANTLNSLGGVLTNTFFVFLTFIFILSEAAGFPNKLKAFSDHGERDLEKYAQITNGVNRYMGIKTLTSMATGVCVTIWLVVQGVDYPVMWGVSAFLLNYIPNIGSIIAAVPAVLLSLIQLGPVPSLVTAVGFLVVNTLIGSVVEPRVMGQGIGLSTLVVFLSLTFWGWVLGPVGMLLSVPLTMAVKIALGGRDSTQWISILLGTNREAEAILARRPKG